MSERNVRFRWFQSHREALEAADVTPDAYLAERADD
jgi:hypothetical protein